MPPSTPFIDRETGTLDTTQILAEAVPLAKLIGLFAAIAFVPFTIAVLLGGSAIGVLLTVVAQFVLAVGAGIVLLYVVVRGIQLAGER